MEREREDVIDIRKFVRKIWQKKKLFFKVLPVVFVLSCVYIVLIPRYYTCSVMLAPEVENPTSGGMLTSLASSFGVNLNAGMTTDAISPTLYPDLMESMDFMVSLFPVKVTTEEGDLSVSYYDYMHDHQKKSVWALPLDWMKKLLSVFKSDDGYKGDGTVNPFRLTKEQKDVISLMGENIQCSVDKKTDVITVTVKDQDPLICACLADTVSARLQKFITAYRTNKARIDMEYYEKLTMEAKADYEDALRRYGQYADANLNVIRKVAELEQTELENEMQLKYNTYSALNAQYQAAKAKVQERTPAFTTLQCATVPIKPAGPKRMLFVLGMLFLGCIGTAIYILKDDFVNQLRKS